MGMAQPQDAFSAWLEAFAQDNDLLLSDDDQLVPPAQHQGHMQDTQLLIAQLQQVPAPAELLPELDMVAGLDYVDVMPRQFASTDAPLQLMDQQQGTSYGGSSSSSKQASGSKPSSRKLRPNNTKRYKSQAQKDAHKRYRERKKQNVSAPSVPIFLFDSWRCARHVWLAALVQEHWWNIDSGYAQLEVLCVGGGRLGQRFCFLYKPMQMHGTSSGLGKAHVLQIMCGLMLSVACVVTPADQHHGGRGGRKAAAAAAAAGRERSAPEQDACAGDVAQLLHADPRPHAAD
jgi:hypothetical protein